jgi:uncharacterized membrane protein
VTHGHSHGPAPRVPARVQRILLLAVAPFALATLIGLALLWPSGDTGGGFVNNQSAARQYRATVTSVDPGGCEGPPTGAGSKIVCSVVEIRLDEGPDESDTFSINASAGEKQRQFEIGDPVLVSPVPEGEAAQPYFFVDYQRDRPLWVLAITFAIVVIALSRWRGLMSLIGMGLSLLLLVWFVIPAILEGSNPLAVAIVGSAAIMFLTLYLAHGPSARTTTAVLGTLASLALTGVLAIIFVELARFTGFSSEEAAFLQLSAGQVNLEGLLLGGIIIGTLGVLDDVTVTQAAAVWELHAANPEYGFRNLYSAGIRIGRDHIASTVNTLVLAYAGASLPLLILFSISNRALGGILTTEVVAEELVRTFVGSIGLVASVPITTLLTAAVVSHVPGGAPKLPKVRPPRPERAERRGKFEREWFGERDDVPPLSADKDQIERRADT